MKNDVRVKNAAFIAKTFHLDPVDVLNTTNFLWNVRLAAHEVIQKHEEEQAAKIKRSKK